MAELPYGARVGMQPTELRLAVCAAGDDEVRELTFDPMAGALADDAADIAFSFDGETIEVSIVPKCELYVKACALELRHAFATEELVLMNGYQSWTDTVERPAWARMRGLRGIPSVVVNHFVLDGGGDYRFRGYSGVPGRQHGYTYGTFRRGEGMVLVGSLDESRGFTEISIYARHGRVVLTTECPLRPLAAGVPYVLGRYAIVRGILEDCYDRYFELMGVAPRTTRKLVGFSSWYRHYNGIDGLKLAEDLAGIVTVLPPLLDEFSGVGAESPIALFQIDDGYCKVGDWLDIDSGKFPHGLAPLVESARNAGFLPGLWIAPFVCERESRIFVEHPEWLLRDEGGNPVPTGSHWTGGYALDTRNPEVRSYVLEVLQTMVGEWGFGLLKMDFLYAACMLPHDGLNRGQLMTDAVDLLRMGAGDDCLILGCGVPLGPVFGKFDYCRIGCDVGLDWNDSLYMQVLHRERVSTKNSLANTYGRAPLDGRAFGNDPDVFFLRKSVRLTQDQRDELLFADADLGSVFLTSDNMGAWDEAQLDRFRQALKLFLE